MPNKAMSAALDAGGGEQQQMGRASTKGAGQLGAGCSK